MAAAGEGVRLDTVGESARGGIGVDADRLESGTQSTLFGLIKRLARGLIVECLTHLERNLRRPAGSGARRIPVYRERRRAVDDRSPHFLAVRHEQ